MKILSWKTKCKDRKLDMVKISNFYLNIIAHIKSNVDKYKL